MTYKRRQFVGVVLVATALVAHGVDTNPIGRGWWWSSVSYAADVQEGGVSKPVTRSASELEQRKLDIDQRRLNFEWVKWFFIALGAVISFWVVDRGKLKLERYRATAENQRQLLDAYLKATESPQPEVWMRKLHILEHFADDDQMRKWARGELEYIQQFAGLDALYRETLRIASQLVEPERLNEPDRVQARFRYNQLYWADLPFAGESPDVISTMIAFRTQLMAAEREPADKGAWAQLNVCLIDLSRALRKSTPNYPPQLKMRGDNELGYEALRESPPNYPPQPPPSDVADR